MKVQSSARTAGVRVKKIAAAFSSPTTRSASFATDQARRNAAFAMGRAEPELKCCFLRFFREKNNGQQSSEPNRRGNDQLERRLIKGTNQDLF